MKKRKTREVATRELRPPPLPSLNALYAFDVAARHESFTRAAQELNVTQTAVSHQIKSLEDELGLALFRRTPRRLRLTPEGIAWSTELRGIFQRLREVNFKLRTLGRSERPVVAVSVMPSFGARWLVPRLGRFMSKFPEVDVRISASERLVDFAVEPFDLGIRFGQGRYPGLYSEKLSDDAWVVVASPSYVEKHRLTRTLDLAKCTLLCDDEPNAWENWLSGVGSRTFKPVAQVQITDSSMLVEAALLGQGVGLARWSLAYDALDNGRLMLVLPKLVPQPTDASYYLVGPKESFRRPSVRQFCDWLRAEATALRTLGAPPTAPPKRLAPGR